MNALEALAKWSSESPNKSVWTFLNDKGDLTESYTYKELHGTVQFLSHSLKAKYNLKRGDRVLLVFFPGLDFTVSLLACFMAGLIAVPVFPPDPRRLKKDLHHFISIQSSSSAQVVLTNSQYSFAKKVEGIKALFSNSTSKWPSLNWIQVDDVIRTGKSSASSSRIHASKEGQEDVIENKDIAFLQYTSGSTSDPKGVMISHGNLAHNLTIIIKELRASQSTVNVSWLPQYHDMGLIGSYLGAMYCGGSGYYLSPISFLKDPTLWLRVVSKYRGTHTQAPNFAFALAARKFNESKQQDLHSFDLSSLEHMINAAEPVDFNAIAAFYRTFQPYGLPPGVVYPTYGLAEHTVFVCSGGRKLLHVTKRSLESGDIQVVHAGELNAYIAGSEAMPESSEGDVFAVVGCGYPGRQEGVRVVLVDSSSNDNTKISRDCLVGEIWVDSPSKALGYWANEEQSNIDFKAKLHSTTDSTDKGETKSEEEKLDESREFLRTGDLGFFFQGELFICGRLKDLIIVGGSNHYPQVLIEDIERTCEHCCDQLRAGCSAAFSVPGQNEAVVYMAELKEGVSAGEYSAIVDKCREAVAGSHGLSLATVCLLAPRSISKTTSGKIARAWCRRAFIAGSLQLLHRSDNTAAAAADVEAAGAQEFSSRGNVSGYSPLPNDTDAESPKENAQEPKKSSRNVSKSSSLEEILQQLEIALLQISAQGPSELVGPIDRNTALLSLGLDSMTIVQFKGVLENRFFCEIPDEFLFTNLATLNELSLAVKEGSLTPSQKQRFESSAEAAANTGTGESPTTIPLTHKEPWCPWFTCCY